MSVLSCISQTERSYREHVTTMESMVIQKHRMIANKQNEATTINWLCSTAACLCISPSSVKQHSNIHAEPRQSAFQNL